MIDIQLPDWLPLAFRLDWYYIERAALQAFNGNFEHAEHTRAQCGFDGLTPVKDTDPTRFDSDLAHETYRAYLDNYR